MVGTWKKGPGAALFQALEAALGSVPILAEDLGVITADVVALRKAIGAPGMVVLQFAWGGGPANTHLPHNIYDNCFVYPGACVGGRAWGCGRGGSWIGVSGWLGGIRGGGGGGEAASSQQPAAHPVGLPALAFTPPPLRPPTLPHPAAGTHDNQTSVGWWKHGAQVEEKALIRRYSGLSDDDVAYCFIREALKSCAHTAVVTMQVIPGGGEGRGERDGCVS